MSILRFLMLIVIPVAVAQADFSYTTVSRTRAGERTGKHYIKGQRIIDEDGDRVTVMDLDAQTETIIDKAKKTYSVRPFSEIAGKPVAGPDVHADIKKTGQHRTINGFDAEETVMTMSMQGALSGRSGGTVQAQVEVDVWLASDVPGIEEVRAFYEKNANRMPWTALAGATPGMADIQRALATTRGVAVLTTVKMKSAGPNDQMAQGRARLEEMKKQGGPQAAMAEKLLAQMGGSEPVVTNESTGFSAGPVPDSVYAIPAGYQKVDK